MIFFSEQSQKLETKLSLSENSPRGTSPSKAALEGTQDEEVKKILERE